MIIDGTTRILLKCYDPTNEALQARISASEGEVLHTHRQTNKVSPANSQELAYKSASGRTGVMKVVMNSSVYSDTDINKACSEFNRVFPEKMSNSFTLLQALDGIPAGSWVFITYEDL